MSVSTNETNTAEGLPPPRSRQHKGVYDALVIGGGLVGSAIAYGLRQKVEHVAVLDENDTSYRASRGNFGLVWVQSKGMGMPAYGHWTMSSQQGWGTLARMLHDLTGLEVGLEQNGGLHPVLTDEEYEARIQFMNGLLSQPGMVQYDWKMLDRKELKDLVPAIGPEVRGATFTSVDGVANPLKLLRALHTAFDRQKVDYLPHHSVGDIQNKNGLFEMTTPYGVIRANKIVLASGLNNQKLGEQIGLAIPVRPQRGQIVVLERTRRILHTPFSTLRQMDEGTWLIGDSQEEAGYADGVIGLPVLATLADRAVRTIPALKEVRVVRSWSALRVMSKDGFPIYEQSSTHPGAFVATCHSGVTLAAAHALRFAPMVIDGALPEAMSPFSTRRFYV